MLEYPGRFGCLGRGVAVGDGGQQLPQPGQRLVGGTADGIGYRQMFQRPAHLQNGLHLLLAQNAALVFHDGDEGAQVAPAAVIGHHRSLPGPHLHKRLLGQFGHAAVDHGAAHLHLPRQLPFGGQLGAHRQLARQNHSPQLLDKQVL